MKKIYVVGGSIGYANWILPLGYQITNKKEEAEVFLFTGGADLDPALYGEEVGFYTNHDSRRSIIEKQYFDFAVENGIKMFGTCLGCQTLGVLGIPNAKLIQHMMHPSRHSITLPYHNNLQIDVPSCHHQMLFLDESKEGQDYLLVGYANKLSHIHLNGKDQDYDLPNDYREVEGVYIPSVRALGFQTHFEFLDYDHPSIKVAQNIFYQYLG